MVSTPYLHTGSSLLNLALTGKIRSGYPLGRVINVIGDKSTGKTLLAIEAAHLFLNLPEQFKPRVSYFEAEAAFDLHYAAALGLQVDKINFIRKQTIEELYDELQAICKEPPDESHHFFCIDSLDALTTEKELEDDIRKGSFNMGKQKLLNRLFREFVSPLEERNVSLFILSQVRMNIDPRSFEKFQRSGGKGLDHFCSQILMMREVGKMKKKTTSDRPYGIEVEVNVKKNKSASPLRKAKFPIIFNYGIDEIHSLINFLLSKELPANLSLVQKGAFYSFPGTDKRVRREDFIKAIEDTPELYTKLLDMTQAAWDYLEEDCNVERRAKSEYFQSEYAQGKTKKNVPTN